MYGLALISPPAIEPLALADAKLHLKVDFTDDDTLISALITAAREYAETFTGKSFITRSYELYLDHFPSLGLGGSSGSASTNAVGFGYAMQGWVPGYGRGAGQFFNNGIIQLPRTPVQEVSSIYYLDLTGTLQVLDPSQYVVDLTHLVPRITPIITGFWPIAMRSLISPAINVVTIPFTAGYGAATTVSGGQSLPESVLTVASTAGFPTSGTLIVGAGQQVVSYTGISGNTFTGCTGGTGSIADGSAVVWNNTPMVVIQAMKLLIGHWYANREEVITGQRAAAVKLPTAAEALMWSERILEV